MENQTKNYNQDNNTVSKERRDKKKKTYILITIEVILLLLVIALAIIFFSSKGGGALNIFKSSGDNNIVNQAPDSGDLQINDNIIDSDDDSLTPNNANVSTPSRSDSQIVESLRLSLPVPDQSPVSSEENIPEGAIKILGLEDGFSPSEFIVERGEEITLALTSRIKYPVVLTFYEETMPAISIGCGPYETRWMTFTVPSTPGEYVFRNDVFGKTNQTGKMIVQ